MSQLVKVLMERDEISQEAAEELVSIAQQEIVDGADIEEVLEDLGVESDYLYDLLPV